MSAGLGLTARKGKMMIAFTVAMAMLGVVAAGTMWSGFVLSILWGWFFVPALGAPVLSVPSAIGISLVVSYMTHQYIRTNKSDSDGWGGVVESVAYVVIKPAFALLTGWIVKQWI